MTRPLRNLATAVGLGVALTACQTAGTRTILTTPSITPPPVTIPKVDPVQVQPVQVKVLNADDLVKLAMQVEASGEKIVLITMDGDNFKHLDENLIDIKRYIQQQNEVVDFLTQALNGRGSADKPTVTVVEKPKPPADLKTDLPK